MTRERRAWLIWLPLAIFIGLASAFVLGLRKPAENSIVSKMVGAGIPDFTLPAAVPETPGLASKDLKGQGPHLVNFFASWCVPCAAEAPVLSDLAKAGVPIVGIAIRDRRESIEAFFARYGNPYLRIGADTQAKAQIDFGSSGVPETFVVDGQGMIRLQIIGPIGPQHLAGIREAMSGK